MSSRRRPNRHKKRSRRRKQSDGFKHAADLVVKHFLRIVLRATVVRMVRMAVEAFEVDILRCLDFLHQVFQSRVVSRQASTFGTNVDFYQDVPGL
jgi:hypothetical protein